MRKILQNNFLSICAINELQGEMFAFGKKARPGIAMMTVVLILLFMMIIAGVSMNLLVRGSGIAGSNRRYLSVFEAAESGVERGMLAAEIAVETGATPGDTTLNLDDKNISLALQHLFTSSVSGANIAYGGSGYTGLGTGMSSGGSAVFFRIVSDAQGTVRERSTIETAYKKIVGVAVR